MEPLRPLPPDKEFFNISEACRIVQIPAYTLRYWERQFGILRPVRRESGHRRYTRKDLETIIEIKDLLQHRKMTVQGARRALIGRRTGKVPGAANGSPAAPAPASVKILREIREELRRLLDELK